MDITSTALGTDFSDAAHLTHDEIATPAELAADCQQAQRNLGLSTTAPSIRFEDFPSDLPKREISIPEAAARLSAALHQD